MSIPDAQIAAKVEGKAKLLLYLVSCFFGMVPNETISERIRATTDPDELDRMAYTMLDTALNSRSRDDFIETIEMLLNPVAMERYHYFLKQSPF